MFQRLRDARLLWPTLATTAAFAVLIGLGTWQWQRMQWKQGLLQDLEQARTTAPVPLSELLDGAGGDGALQLEKLRFRQVRVPTIGQSGPSLFVWNPQRAGPAWSVIRALSLTEPLAGYDHVFTIEGTVSEKDRAALGAGLGAQNAPDVIGRVRLDAPNTSAPDPVLARAEWFTRDLASMRDHIAQTTGTKARFLPFFIEYTGPVRPPLRANTPRITLTNRHFEYALTWWGLAATLIGVYATFVVSRLRAAE